MRFVDRDKLQLRIGKSSPHREPSHATETIDTDSDSHLLNLALMCLVEQCSP